MESNAPFDICLCLGRSWVQHCCVLIVSILENAADSTRYHFHIVSEDLQSSDMDSIQSLVTKYGGSASFYSMPNGIVNGLPISHGSHLSSETYIRLFLPIILPATLTYVLYLDCDIVCVEDIGDLFPLDWCGESYISAVHETWDAEDHASRIGISGNGYFNTGVMVMNIALLRTFDLPSKSMLWLDRNRTSAAYADQDALNYVFSGSVLPLAKKWNVYPEENGGNPRIFGREVTTRVEDAKLIHFAGAWKPWNYNLDEPLKKLYYKYLPYTPYAHSKPTGRSVAIILKKMALILLRSWKRPRRLAVLLSPRRLIQQILYNF